ncbi:MAG: transposase [Planctomycetaceae bacterium]
MRSPRPLIKKVTRMLKNRIRRILTWFSSTISNAKSAGFCSRIKAIKPAAHGFRIFENYRPGILFCCGKLCLKPSEN